MIIKNTFLKQLHYVMLILVTQFNLVSQVLCGSDNLDKWIVVTTINYPSAALKKLAALKDWHLVVVGDRKTPEDWQLENCEFLSIAKQQTLDYEIIKLLPENHYCRKNIGYLYAISCGARVIYETDDDNELIDDIFTLPYDELVEVSVEDKNLVNIFSYFGQPTVWPRGFPLDQIFNCNNYQIKNVSNRQQCSIIQGLINKDPDVDGIFRLTQKRDVYFEKKAPCMLPVGKFCPFNTQNTIFFFESFWGLMIPSTAGFRVCDIWRSYIVQRLLFDLDLRICFTPPTVVQERNKHDLFRDFCDEQDLYLKSGSLCEFLLNWKSKGINFSERMEDLIRELVAAKYLKNEEIRVVQAWIRDLTKLGYQFPKLQ
jgi:STELLO glycosyltransferases